MFGIGLEVVDGDLGIASDSAETRVTKRQQTSCVISAITRVSGEQFESNNSAVTTMRRK